MSGKKSKVFVSRLIAPEARVLEILEPHFDLKMGKPPFNEEVCMRELKDVDGALVTMDCPITRRVMESTPRLKIVSKYGAGLENIDLQAAAELGVIIGNSPLNFQSVAEGAVFLMLGCLRNITRVMNYLKEGRWTSIALPGELLGHELYGKTVGIIGLGRVGSYLSRLLKCFGARALAFDPYVSSDKAAQVGAKLVDLENLLKKSDIVSINCALTSETRNLIGEKTLKLMKPTAILINTARGGIVDEKALYVALKERWIAGAGLDVLDPEPPDPDNPLFKLDNAFVTPHIAGATVDARERLVTQAAQNLVEVLVNGRLPPKNCIANPKVQDYKMRIHLKKR